MAVCSTIVAFMKLDPAASDRILDVVRPYLPDGVKARRSSQRSLLLSYRLPKRGGRSSAAAFAHISSLSNPAQAVAVALRAVIRQVDDLFKSLDIRWPGLDWGPTTIKARAVDGQAYVTITDVAGHALEIGPVSPTASSELTR
jgi:hypothetical protein